MAQPITQATIDFSAGAVGGFANVLSGQPLDTVKVKMQMFPTKYRSFIHCFVSTYRLLGVRGLYKGTIPALMGSVSYNSVLFMSYGFCQDLIRAAWKVDKGATLSDVQKASAGALASFISTLVICPAELIKCRLQAMHEVQESGVIKIRQKSTAWAVAKTVIKTKGLLGFYEGLIPTIVREVPGSFCYFAGYEVSRTLFALYLGTDKGSIGFLPLMLCGGFGGFCFWPPVFPLDSVKSRIQVLSVSGKPMSSFKTFEDIIRSDGFTALYSGLAPTLIRTVIASSMLFLSYELTRKSLMKIFIT